MQVALFLQEKNLCWEQHYLTQITYHNMLTIDRGVSDHRLEIVWSCAWRSSMAPDLHIHTYVAELLTCNRDKVC